ncbi:hypothetical protein SCUCBS95973_000949 [Sporothrix curviconia]|uniref:Heterokaryon incompatibility domain-containing protein n=1 Tax=Sporothrix curviconia TaxID=1260050 RepID=A0ABP0AUG2_9PEZI
MRLINTSSLEFEEYYPPNVPPYAILSHRWGPSEVTFQDFQSKSRKSRDGYTKIMNMVRLARDLKHKFIWVDTCCIDKTNNSELSEAINSMYQWYRDAAVCVAFLEDVPRDAPNKKLFESRWFTRGWTLQELVAPRHVFFYDADWVSRGPKTGFVNEIRKRTNIPHRILAGLAEPSSYSLARRMSWASGRETTRIEDIAYCLLGILNVNMPLLYGEGKRAFRRLQEEILRHQSDMTIFAWQLPQDAVPSIQAADTTAGNGNGNGAGSSMMVPVPVTSKQSSGFRPGSPGNAAGRASPASPASLATQRAVLPATPSLTEKTARTEKGKNRSVSPSTSATSSTSRAATSAKPPMVSKAVPSPGASTVAVTTPTAAHMKPKRTQYCLFAPSPESFSGFGSLHPFMDNAEGFTVTNRGIFVSGSMYLRLVSKRSADDKSPRTNHYLLLLGTQNGLYIGIYLIKVGPNQFQRDWDAGIAGLKEEDVMMLQGFLVHDWYILIDSASLSTTKMLRQSAVHIPTKGHGNDYVRLKDMAPTHLWDVQDRLFLRPKAYAWTRYDMVLAVKCAVIMRNTNFEVPDTPDAIAISKHVTFVVLCRYRLQKFDPKFIVFLEEEYPRETDMLMMRRTPDNSLLWSDLDVFCPQLAKLPNHVMVDVGEKSARTGEWRSSWYCISAFSVKEKADFEYDEPELFKVYFDVEHDKNYHPVAAKAAYESGAEVYEKAHGKLPVDRKPGGLAGIRDAPTSQ